MRKKKKQNTCWKKKYSHSGSIWWSWKSPIVQKSSICVYRLLLLTQLKVVLFLNFFGNILCKCWLGSFYLRWHSNEMTKINWIRIESLQRRRKWIRKIPHQQGNTAKKLWVNEWRKNLKSVLHLFAINLESPETHRTDRMNGQALLFGSPFCLFNNEFLNILMNNTLLLCRKTVNIDWGPMAVGRNEKADSRFYRTDGSSDNEHQSLFVYHLVNVFFLFFFLILFTFVVTYIHLFMFFKASARTRNHIILMSNTWQSHV